MKFLISISVEPEIGMGSQVQTPSKSDHSVLCDTHVPCTIVHTSSLICPVHTCIFRPLIHHHLPQHSGSDSASSNSKSLQARSRVLSLTQPLRRPLSERSCYILT